MEDNPPPDAHCPILEAVDEDTLLVPELLGAPEVPALLGYTRRPLHLPDGKRMGLFSFSFSAPANWLFLVDASDMTSKRYAMPNNDVGSHGGALGADGNIYIVGYGTGGAYRFNVADETFEKLPCDLPKEEYPWDAIGHSNGCIYFGTYPSAYFGEYSPADGEWTLWKQPVPDTKYVCNLSVSDDGAVRFRAFGPAEVWMSFDPVTRAFTAAEKPGSTESAVAIPLPDPPPDDDSWKTPYSVAGRRFAVAFPSGRLYELPDGQAPVLLGETGCHAEPTWWLKASGHSLTGVSYFGGLFRYDLATGAFERGHLDNRAPGGNSIMFLESVGPRCAVGANYSQQNLFAVDPETGAITESPGAIARVPGEPMCAVGFGGRAYLGIYVNSVISVYDPTRPFAFDENPRRIAMLGEQYAQTRPRAAVTDGRRVFISSDSAYNHLGGALAVIDPETEKVDVYHHLIPDQNLPSLAYDPATGLLWGGTDRWGQMRSHPPTQESALVYAFDPVTRELAHSLALWPGSDVTMVHGVGDGGVLLASSGNEVALVDTRTREVLYRGALPIAVPGMLRRGSDGRSYCLSGGTLYRWDFSAGCITPVAKTDNCTHLTEPSPGLWLLANSTSVYRLRMRP